MWGKAYNTHLNDLELLQNKAMRVINDVPTENKYGQILYRKEHFLLKHIYNHNTGLLMHKYINNMTPDVLNNFFRNSLIYVSMI